MAEERTPIARTARMLGITWLALLALMLGWVWLLPNLQQIMANQPYAINSIPLVKTRLVWKQNTVWAILTAVAMITSLMATHETATFIYFQF